MADEKKSATKPVTKPVTKPANRDQVKISVRNLVEFIFRAGDIVSGGSGARDTDAMQMGTKIHKKIQKSMGSDYQAEVPLFVVREIKGEEECFDLKIEGRADGIMRGENLVTIDEIKGVFFDIFSLKEPVFVHKAQAMCYAYMVASAEGLNEVEVQITYCHMESEQIRRFQQTFTYSEIEQWFLDLVEVYSKWAMYEYKWKKERNASIQNVEFPFPYREGQKELVVGVYRTIQRERKLFLEAPTGVGKTISTVFPAVKAMGENLCDRIFYLTAKTITRTVAEECFETLEKQQLHMKPITLTAKDKTCILEHVSCNPGDCERAKGHFDRINDALFDLITHEKHLRREVILTYADKHKVCPHELSLDAALYADAVICDYNHVFDPNVKLKRFFGGEKKEDYILLIDEAHNLVERGREMFSASICKEDFLKTKKRIKKIYEKEPNRESKLLCNRFMKSLDKGNKELLELKRQCDEFTIVPTIGSFSMTVLRVMANFEEFLKEYPDLSDREELLDFYFDIRHFSGIVERLDDKYQTYTDYIETGEFQLRLQCMDPSDCLRETMDRVRSTILFSATLLPVKYYRSQLGGLEEDYAVYAPSSFPEENRRIFVARDVSSKYTRRGPDEYTKIASYINTFVEAKTGNYLIFFPSYAFLDNVASYLKYSEKIDYIRQERDMKEGDKEDFLRQFDDSREATVSKVGLCVLGGIFSEGIDLTQDRLIGAAIVGTGLPMVCNERELFRDYYEEKRRTGFEYAYLYPGMNKVLQSGGRVIRTATDRGVILLLDERFLGRQYQSLFPREWEPRQAVDAATLKEELTKFWT